MKNIALALVLALTAISAKVWACDDCESGTYQERCGLAFVQAGYSGSISDSCVPINSEPALKCMEALIRNGYSNIDRDAANGCSWATECGVVALNALFNNRYSNTDGNFIKSVGQTRSWTQARCFASLFNGRYVNVTADNIRSACP